LETLKKGGEGANHSHCEIRRWPCVGGCYGMEMNVEKESDENFKTTFPVKNL